MNRPQYMAGFAPSQDQWREYADFLEAENKRWQEECVKLTRALSVAAISDKLLEALQARHAYENGMPTPWGHDCMWCDKCLWRIKTLENEALEAARG